MVGTALAIGLGLTAAGTTINAIGNIKAGNAARRAGEFNARVAELQAEDALARGEQEASRYQLQIKSLVGQARAGFAGQNVEVGTGSALNVQADLAYWGEMDTQQIRANAAREAWGHRVEAVNARIGGRAAQAAGRWGAASSIIGGGGNILTTIYGPGRLRPSQTA